MKKKIVSVSLALVFVMAVLAGCAGKSGESGSGPGSGSEAGLTENGDSVSEDGLGHIGNGEDITLKMLATQEDQEVLKEMADAFARKYSEDVNLTVELEACPQKDINKKILTNLELAADLYMFPNDDLRFLAESGALQEVSLNTDKIIEENGGVDTSAIQAASYDSKLSAYPSAYNSGLVLYYNQKYFAEDDVKRLDDMMDIANENGKKVSINFTSGMYLWSFFGGAGFRLALNDDGSNMCDMNHTADTGVKGVDVLQTMVNICSNNGFSSLTEKEFIKGVQNGSVIAGIGELSDAEVIKQAWKDDYAAAKLPSYKLNGTDVQMTSFAGYQFIGINPYSENVGWAMRFAEWVTNEKNQLARYQSHGAVPTNTAAHESDLIKEDLTARAIAEQGKFSLADGIQSDYFWKPMASLGGFCIEGNAGEEELQAFLDDTVEKITKPVQQEK